MACPSLFSSFRNRFPLDFMSLMHGTDAFNVEHELLSAFVWFACAVEAQRANPRLKAEKAVFWERLIFIRYVNPMTSL